jgi:hypothetical protein
MALKRNTYSMLVGGSERRRPLGRPRSRWVDNIRMVLGEVGWGGIYWIDVAEVRGREMALVNTVMNIRVL